MVKCKFCSKEMLKAAGCIRVPHLFKDGIVMEPIKYQNEDGSVDANRCRDCACMSGYYHHPGCDNEKCPRCGGQSISCNCEKEE
jgi:hypothetical protein